MRRDALAPVSPRCVLPWSAAVAALTLGAALSCTSRCGPESEASRQPPARAARSPAEPRRTPSPAASSRTPQPAARRVFRLAAGPGVERRLEARGVDVYEIGLVPGQYLYATVDQRGVDVGVGVYGPGGNRLFLVDSPYGPHGAERIYLVAETGGAYRLQVGARQPGSSGRYLARLAVLRPAALRDRRRAAAERSFYEALEIRGQRPRAREAAAKFAAAARAFQELGLKERQAEALYRLGRLDFDQGRHDDAVGLLQAANALFRAAHDHWRVASSYQLLARACGALGALDRASRAYRRAAAEWRRIHQPVNVAEALVGLGDLYAFHGKPREALPFYRRASHLSHLAGDALGEATAAAHAGSALRLLGDLDHALIELRRGLELCHTGDARQRAALLAQIGHVHLAAQQTRRALPCFMQALALQSAAEDRDAGARADTLVGLGVAYRRLRQYGESLAAYAEALRVYQATGDRREEASAWFSLGVAYSYMRQPQRAAQCYETALRLARETGYRATEALALLGMGTAARDRRNPLSALAYGEAAIRVVEALRADASRPDLQTSYMALNENYYGFLVGILMQLHAMQPARGFDLRALQRSEQSRARCLLDGLVARRGSRAAAHAADPALLADRRRLARQIAAKDLELRQAAAAGSSAAAVEKQLQDLWERSQDLEELVRKSERGSSPSPGSLPAALAGLQRGLLDDRTVLLEYYLGVSKSFLWAVTDDSVASFELPGRASLEALARSTYDLLSRGRQPDAEEDWTSRAARLSQVLLGQVADRLGDRRLLIVADGALQYIPFAALPDPLDPDAPLIMRHEIVYAPSLAVLAELRSRQCRVRPAGPIAIIADPVFGWQDDRARMVDGARALLDPLVAALPRLPFSRSETAGIAALAGRRGVFAALGFAANRELVTGGFLRRFWILHFLTHGTLRMDRPELSGLALSQLDAAGRPRDGWLRAYEIADLDLPARLVVLSACKTALGKETGGEGMVGLPQSFMSAGAQAVLVSLWDVGDRSTAELMVHFYRGLLVKKLPPGAALRDAQLAMWRDQQWRAPCHWAGFVLQGDWR